MIAHKTPFSKRCEILGQVWVYYREDANDQPAWKDFFDWADIGLPLAYSVWQGYVSTKDSAKVLVDETWDVFCSMINVDAHGKYSDLSDIFSKSPNKPIDK